MSDPSGYYIGDVGKNQEWRQCETCHGYAFGPIGSSPKRHTENCPVSRLERYESALLALEQEMRARVKAMRAGNTEARRRMRPEAEIMRPIIDALSDNTDEIDGWADQIAALRGDQ